MDCRPKLVGSQGKLLILIAGGTWATKKVGGKWKVDLRQARDTLVQIEPHIESKARIVALAKKYFDDSSQFTPQHWIEIGKKIAEEFNHDSYAGVVVGHGTDTMHYTAAALSFILHGLSVPVVITGAQMSFKERGSDFPRNFRESMRVASEADLSEVCIVFNHKILRGTRVRKMRMGGSPDFLDAFESVNCKDLGRVDGGKVHLDKSVIPNPRLTKHLPVTSALDLESRVVLLKVFPGMPPTIIDYLIEKLNCRGIVLESLGDAGLRLKGPADTRSMFRSIKRAFELKVPVVLCSQVTKGKVVGDYAPYRKIQHFVIKGGDMLPEVALAKLMWVMRENGSKGKGRSSSEGRKAFRARILRKMHRPVAHEITPDSWNP